MEYPSRIKPISHLASYEATRALLKILALGRQQVEEGRAIPLVEAVRRLRARRTGR